MALTVISTVLVAATADAPAGPYDLTDLATAKDELDISDLDTSKDAFLSRAITQVSASFATYCNRVFPVETVQDAVYPARDAYPYQVPGGVGVLQLSRWPLIVPPVALPTSADTPTGAVLPFASTAGIVVGQPAAHASIPVGAVVTAIATNVSVTLSAPITADVPPGAVVTFGFDVRITDPPGTVTLLTAGQDYQIDAAVGQLIRLNQWTGYPTMWDPVLTTVCYQGGYPAIPADLVDATLREVTKRYASRGRDPLLKSRDQPALGTETYWIGSVPGVRGAFTEEIAALIDKYRVPVAV